MISVTVKKHRNEYVSFKTKGHADYDEYDRDILCSAVSMIVINTINSIEEFTDCKFKYDSDEDKGIINISFEGELPHDAHLLMDSMMLGLESIRKQYGKRYLKVTNKEV